MPDIFLSYSREDQPTARRYAEAFERAGLSVWWDQSLNAGEAYDEVTESALREARAVVVLWSKKSVVSRWVRAEATQADRARTLVPIMIEPCTRPIMFELTQTADLSHWQGDVKDPVWKALLASIQREKVAGDGVATSSVPSLPPPQRKAGRRGLVMGVAAGLVLLAVAGVWISGRTNFADVEKPGAALEAAAASAAATPASLAVLPFANLSPDPAQEFFSDGLTEELLNQLAQVSSLRVIGRTSSFAFKGRKEDLPTIGKLLGVNHILEGSVRKDGNRLRITASLINPADGSQLWSETYERTLDDVFAIQEEIARTVTAQMKLKIGAKGLVSSGTRNVAAYEEFLAGRALLNATDGALIRAAAPHLVRAVELDPAFLPAWLWLVDALTRDLLNDSGGIDRLVQRQDEAIARVVALAPGTPEASFALSYRAARDLDLQLLRRLLQESLALTGSQGARARIRYGQFLAAVGQTSAAVAELERVKQDDPLDVFARTQLLLSYELTGDSAKADAEMRQLLELTGGRSPGVLGTAVTRAQGTTDKAALKSALAAMPEQGGGVSPLDSSRWLDEPAAARKELRQLLDASRMDESRNTRNIYSLSGIAQWAAYFGERKLALQALREMRQQAYSFEAWVWIIWRPVMREVRADPAAKDFLVSVGLPEFWRATNQWGDYCRPIGAGDFQCR